MRPYQVGTAAAIVVIAAVAMFDSRGAFNIAVGTSPGDVGASWYPFWSAALMALGAVWVGVRAFTIPSSGESPFESRTSVLSVLKLVIPMFIYAFSFQWLGFYIATGLYMAFFAWYLGHYRWWAILAVGVITPVAVYVLFEAAFRLILPKSIFYLMGFPF
ncbi:MAG TPA: tripartite tricarboxylate transporter TctB family protein [Candidatus Limnocylindria bacterium]